MPARGGAPLGGRGRAASLNGETLGRAGVLGRRGELRGRKAGVLGRERPEVDAPVDGTAALRVEPAVVEPLRVSPPAGAPRLQVAPPAPISAPRAPFVAAVIGVVIVGVLGILLINTKTNENSFKIADLQKQNTALDNQRQDLDNQLVEVSSIGNLDAAARRLGLVKADHPALIRLPDGKLIGVLTPTDGTPAVTAQQALTSQGATDPNADKGAANIVPDGTATGGTATGGTSNGTATNGTTTNGTTNGTATDGTATAGTGTTAGTSTTGGTGTTSGTGTTGDTGTTGTGTTGTGR